MLRACVAMPSRLDNAGLARAIVRLWLTAFSSLVNWFTSDSNWIFLLLATSNWFLFTFKQSCSSVKTFTHAGSCPWAFAIAESVVGRWGERVVILWEWNLKNKTICAVSLMKPKGITSLYWWWGQGYHLPVSGSCAYTACESSSFLELSPAPVPLSAFCTFQHYTVYCWRASELLVQGGGLLPTTFLGLLHRGVAGQVISLVPVVSLLESLTSRRAETCVVGIKEGCRSPNQRVWVMVWEELYGYRKSLSESMVKLKWIGKKSSFNWQKNLVAGKREVSASSCSGPRETNSTAACSCTTSFQCSLTGSGVLWASSTLAT